MFFLAGFLFFIYVFRLWLSGFLGIHPDEAYYWTWAQNLKLGYFDHPPMIAWLIAGGKWILQKMVSEEAWRVSPLFWEMLSLRLLPYFFSTVLTPLFLAKSIEWAQRKIIRDFQILALITSPIFIFGSQFVTPDIPLFTAWSFCLMITIRFLRSHKRNAMHGKETPFLWGWATLLGIGLAVAAYSKYSAILIAFLIVMTGAGLMNSILAGLISFTLVLPYFYWNYAEAAEHGAGILFQLKHGLGDSIPNPGQLSNLNWKRMGDLVAVQVAFWTPYVFFASFVLLFTDVRRFFMSAHKSKLTGSLFIWAAVPLIFFCLTSLRQPAEANWPLVGLVGATVLVYSRLYHRGISFTSITLNNLFVLGLTYGLLAKNSEIADFLEPHKPALAAKLREPSRIYQFQDWKRVHALAYEGTSSHPKLPIEVRSYQLLAELLFHDKSAHTDEHFGDRLKIWPEGSRKSEFNFVAKYIPERPAKARWLLCTDQILNDIPNDCKLNSVFSKSANEKERYHIYKCGF